MTTTVTGATLSGRLRILHCLSTRELAGTERHLAELVRAQMTRHHVTLLLENNTRDPRTGGDIRDLLPPEQTETLDVIRAGRRGYLLRLAALERSRRFDIIHTHLGRASARATWLKRVGAWRGTPLIATLHTSYRARSYGLHDRLVCIASWQSEALPAPRKSRAVLIPNWTHIPRQTSAHRQAVRGALRTEWGLSANTVAVGAVGRMVPEKNFALLLEAWRKADLPESTVLVLIGDGPERARLEHIANGCRRVLFTGFRTDMPDALAGLDAFIMPSRKEPFGLVLLEAMAAGLPVCATAAGGALDILREAPEALIAPDDVEALAAGLRRVSSTARQCWDLSRFTLERHERALEQTYLALCRATLRG